MKRPTIIVFILTASIICHLSADAIFWQNDWSGGSGQTVMSDSSKYFEGLDINTENEYVTLDYFSDTNWTKNIYYPPAAAPSENINTLKIINDTLFIGSGGFARLYWTASGTQWYYSDTLPVNQSESKVLDIEYSNGSVYVGGYWGGESQAFIYRTFDRVHWDTLLAQPAGASTVFDILNVGGDTFLVATGNFDENSMDNDGIMFKSTDGCMTWSRIDTLGYGLLTSVAKLGGDTIIVGGDRALNGVSPLNISFDCGETYDYISNPDNSDAVDIITVIAIIDKSQMTGIDKKADERYIFIGDERGRVYRCDSVFNVWEKLDTTNVIPDTSLISGINVINSVLYVTTINSGKLYKSYDLGKTFAIADSITDVNITAPVLFLNRLFIGGNRSDSAAYLFNEGYYRHGYLISSAIDVSVSYDYYYCYLTIDTNSPRSSSMALRVRSSSYSDMSDATSWDSCEVYNLNDLFPYLGYLNSIENGEKYLQYRFDFYSTSKQATPQLNRIEMKEYYGIYSEENTLTNTPIEISGEFGRVGFYLKCDIGDLDVLIYDSAGRCVDRFNYRTVEKGYHKIITDRLNTGIYFIEFSNTNFKINRKIEYIK